MARVELAIERYNNRSIEEKISDLKVFIAEEKEISKHLNTELKVEAYNLKELKIRQQIFIIGNSILLVGIIFLFAILFKKV